MHLPELLADFINLNNMKKRLVFVITTKKHYNVQGPDSYRDILSPTGDTQRIMCKCSITLLGIYKQTHLATNERNSRQRGVQRPDLRTVCAHT